MRNHKLSIAQEHITDAELKEFMQAFQSEYPYIALFQVDEELIREQLYHYRDRELSTKMNYISDWAMAQGMCDVQI
jgi:hypothetical protein